MTFEHKQGGVSSEETIRSDYIVSQALLSPVGASRHFVGKNVTRLGQGDFARKSELYLVASKTGRG